ncbi:MAG: hypothetical protein GXY44_16465 [Phycisphaerales bacterium]|nr:hypothetical protein [Phycisphaerales bacterium]
MALRQYKTDVLVVGAGPVGLLSALLLRRFGVKVIIVDEQWRTAEHSYALALHGHSLELLDGVGLADDMLALGRRIQTIALYQGQTRKAEIHLDRMPGKYPFVLVLRQSALETLLEHLLRESGAKMHWNHRLAELKLEQDHALATIERLEHNAPRPTTAPPRTPTAVQKQSLVRAAFVVGADGHQSPIRNRLEISYQRIRPADYFAIFEFATLRDPGNEVRIILDERNISVLWPLPGKCCRWSFQIPDAQIPLSDRVKNRTIQIGGQSYPLVNSMKLETLLRDRAPWFDAGVGAIAWSMAVPFETRLAERFGREVCWLAGDAAHMTSPVGMQSMNVGLREAAGLATRLRDILRKKGSADLSQAYEQPWRQEWARLLGQGVEPAANDGTDPWIAANAGRIISCLPASGEHLTNLAGQLGLQI